MLVYKHRQPDWDEETVEHMLDYHPTDAIYDSLYWDSRGEKEAQESRMWIMLPFLKKHHILVTK